MFLYCWYYYLSCNDSTIDETEYNANATLHDINGSSMIKKTKKLRVCMLRFLNSPPFFWGITLHKWLQAWNGEVKIRRSNRIKIFFIYTAQTTATKKKYMKRKNPQRCRIVRSSYTHSKWSKMMVQIIMISIICEKLQYVHLRINMYNNTYTCVLGWPLFPHPWILLSTIPN